MRDGKWLMPRHPSKEVFEKDYPKLDPSPISAYCPGCRASVLISRKAPNGRVGGWCQKCGRGVAP